MKWLKHLFVPEALTLSNGKTSKPPKSIAPYIVILLLIVTYFSIKITDFSLIMVIKRSSNFWDIIINMIPPDWSYISNILKPLLDTIVMSFLGSSIGAICAIPFAVLCSSNINTNAILRQVMRFIFSIIRTIPTLIIALVATFIFGLGSFVGTLSIGIFTFGLVTKMLYENIETVDMGPFEAMESLGATKVEAFLTSVMPQILPTFFSITLYTFEVNVRYAAILGYVGAGGIGLLIDQSLGWRNYARVGSVLLLLLITVLVIETFSRYLRERFS